LTIIPSIPILADTIAVVCLVEICRGAVPAAINAGNAWRWNGTRLSGEPICAIANATIGLVEICGGAMGTAIRIRITRWRH
jgi:hypothetical protein